MVSLETVRQNAIDEGKLPAYVIDFNGRVWVMISESEFLTENLQR